MTDKTVKNLVKYILVNDIPANGVHADILLDERDISTHNTLMPDSIELTPFEAHMKMQFLPGEKILHVEGAINADINTVCSVSLKPMSLCIDEPIDVDYSQKVYEDDNNDETYLLPEKIINGRIDVYEVAIQTLMLALPTHPTLEGASIADLEYVQPSIEEIAKEDKKNPFDVLKNLKDK